MPGGQEPAPPRAPSAPSTPCWGSTGHPCQQRGCASLTSILWPVPQGAWRCWGVSCSPQATGFLFKDDSGGSSQYFCLLAAAAASSLIINCLGWVAPWFSPIPAVSPSLPTRINLSKKKKKNGKGYFRQGQGRWVPLRSTGSQIRGKLPAAKRNPPGHSRDLGGKSRLQWPGTWEHGSGEGCWKPSLRFRCEAIRVGG